MKSNDIGYMNSLFLNDWIKFNPNLSNIKVLNNAIISSKGKEIDLGNLIISDLLGSIYFKNEITSMKEDKFIKIVDIHCKSKKLLSERKKTDYGDNYIKNVYEDKDEFPVIVTSDSNKRKLKLPAGIIIDRYYSLLEKYDNFVPYEALLTSLGIDDEKNDINFFKVISSKSKMNDDRKKYIIGISKFMAQLLYYSNYLVEDAHQLLNIYIQHMGDLKFSDKEKTEREKFALELYSKYQDEYQAYLEKEQLEAEKEEARLLRASSIGYSSIVLIITSVLFTGILIAMVILK